MKLYLKILISFLSFAIFNFNLAQNLSLDFSDNIRVSSDYKPLVCFKNKNKYVLVQKKTKSTDCDIKINLFDNQLNNSNQFDVLIHNHSFISINQFFKKILLFTSENKDNKTTLYVHELDLDYGFTNTKELHSEFNINGYTTSYNIADTTFEQNFYVLAELPFRLKKNEDIKLLTFNNSLKLIAEVYNKLDLIFEANRDNKLLVSPTGQLVMVKTFWKKRNNFYLYQLGKNVINEVEIKLNNREIADIDFLFNAKNELVIAGFFSSQNRYNYEGYFIHKYDEDLKLVHKNQYFFNKNIVENFKSSSEIKENGFGLDKFRLTDFSIDQNTNYFLLAEHLSRKKIKGETRWISKGMLAIKFNKNGNYVWACPIDLKQASSKVKFIGSFHLNSFKSPEYFYNDLSNLKIRKGIPPEYGTYNYCGTKRITFSSVGQIIKNNLEINFPNNNSIKYSFYPKQLNLDKGGKSIFSFVDYMGNNMLIGVEK